MMKVTLEHVETLGRIQRLQPGDQLVAHPAHLDDLAKAGLIRKGDGGVAITLDGTIWLAENRHLLVKVG
jgi:hypothetical protein